MICGTAGCFVEQQQNVVLVPSIKPEKLNRKTLIREASYLGKSCASAVSKGLAFLVRIS